MKRLLFFAALLASVPAWGQAPICFFQDVLSGPVSGGENGDGIYMTITGLHFGSSGTVTVNGTAAAQTFNWGATDVTGNYQTIGLQVSHLTTGSGNVVVTTSKGSCSNLTFTARSGNIYFLGPTPDTSNPGSCATMFAAGNSYSSPWGLTNFASTTESAYSDTTMRTPYYYYHCASPGDVLVFLNGANYPYFDGRGFHASLTPDNGSVTSTSFFTFQVRPGAAVQLGSTGYALGIRGTGASSYDVYSGFTVFGNPAGGSTVIAASNYDRVIGNVIECPNCSNEAGALGGGDGIAALGNLETAISTTVAGGSIKEYHAAYFAGNGVEFGWNRIYNTLVYNGFQINHDGSTGFYNLKVHDNDIADVNGSGVNLSTIDPSSGYVLVYNNILHHNGVHESSDGNADDPHSCIAVKGYYGSSNPGTAQIYNNTMFDCSSNLNIDTVNASSCAILIAANTWSSVTTNMVNNIAYQPAYTGTGNVNVYVCANPAGVTSGSNNIWYSAATPGSTTYAATTGTIENPLYQNAADGTWSNYNLQRASPAIGNGSASLYPAADFVGVTRPNPPAIGALEPQTTSGSAISAGVSIGSGVSWQ